MPKQITFNKFLVKYTVIVSVITWIISAQLRTLSIVLINVLIEPLFSFDLNNDGEPDLKQLEKYVMKSMGFKFPLGKLLLEILKTIITIVIVYYGVIAIAKHTDLLKL